MRAGNRSFIKRVLHHRKILGQRNNSWTEEEIFPCAEKQNCLITAELGQRADMTGHGKIRISTAIFDPNIMTGFEKILF